MIAMGGSTALKKAAIFVRHWPNFAWGISKANQVTFFSWEMVWVVCLIGYF